MHPILSRRGRLGPYLVAWVAPAATFAGLARLVCRSSWLEGVTLALPLTGLYAFICLAAWYPCRVTPLGRHRLQRVLGVHATAALLSAFLWLFLATTWAVFLEQLPPFTGLGVRFPRLAPVLLVAAVLLYTLAAALHYLVIAFEQARDADRRELEVHLLAREAELKALRAQIDPHFLFNALNAISSLVGGDPRAAREMCLALAELLRDSLRLGARAEVALAEELALARAYLAVEQVRFGSRLRLEEEVGAGAQACLVPPLILQPLVENAVGRGISTLVDGGAVRIEASRQGERLALVVENPFDPGSARAGEGLGLSNVRSRLAAFYGGEAAMVVEGGPPRFRVRLDLPAREGGAAVGPGAGAAGVTRG